MDYDYKPNSHKYKAEQQKEIAERPKVEKVVTGKTTVKKNEIRKFTDIFISEDASNVKSYIFGDVLVPAIKKAIDDIVSDGVHMILYGGTGRGAKRSDDYTSYSRAYAARRDSDRRYEDPTRSRSGFEYDDIVFESRGDAERVLSRMDEIMEKYGMVRVGDLYDLADLSCDYTANNYGWRNIISADIVRSRNGYIIRMPRPLPID